MQLFILDTKTCRSIPLPNLPEGEFEVRDRDGRHLIFVIDGAADGWHISPVAPSVLIGGQEAVLKPYYPMYLRAGTGDERWTLYPTAGIAASRAFARCLVPDDVSITVGSAGVPEVTEKLIVMPTFAKVLERLKMDSDSAPYARFVSYLAKLKPLYRCTFLLCASAQELKNTQYEEWFKTQVSNTDGLHLGSGIENQYILTANNALSLSKMDTAFPFGVEIRGGKGRRVKFLSDRFIREGGF